MHKFFDFIKSHPILIMGGLGVIVLFYLLSGSGGGGGQTVVTGPQGPSDAQIAAGAQLQLSQMQLQGQANQLSASLQATNVQAATQVTLAQIGAQVANYQTQKQAETAQAGITAQAQVQTAGIQSQELIAINDAITQQKIAQISADTDQARINAVVAIQNAPYAAMTAFYGDLAQGGVDKNGRNGLVQLLYGAEGTKGSQLVLPGGVMAGRVGSGGGQLFGSSFGASANPFGAISQGVGAAAQLVSVI